MDHVIRAQRRHDWAQGDFCAAAVTYYTIFAMFPLLMVGLRWWAFPAGRPELLAEIDNRVKSAVTGDFANQVLSLMDAGPSTRTPSA